MLRPSASSNADSSTSSWRGEQPATFSNVTTHKGGVKKGVSRDGWRTVMLSVIDVITLSKTLWWFAVSLSVLSRMYIHTRRSLSKLHSMIYQAGDYFNGGQQEQHEVCVGGGLHM
jgi:hypothetical protein